jgi:hypothetical protein
LTESAQSFKKYIFVANDFISPFNTKMHIKSFLYTTSLLGFPKNLIPWQDSNPGLHVLEADAMSTVPRSQPRVSNQEINMAGGVTTPLPVLPKLLL